jgi:hypothetical protein
MVTGTVALLWPSVNMALTVLFVGQLEPDLSAIDPILPLTVTVTLLSVLVPK